MGSRRDAGTSTGTATTWLPWRRRTLREGEEGEEVDVRANREAAREAKGFREQEEQAVHWEAEGQTEGQHKGLRPRLGNGNFVFSQRLDQQSTCPILKYN